MTHRRGIADPAQIAKFLARYVRPDRINGADIFTSPGLNGNSAFEFVEAFTDEFGIDMATYYWPLYHHDEAEMAMPQWMAQIYRRLWRDRPDPDRDFLPVSLQHLADVSAVGHWFAPSALPRQRHWPSLWRTALQWLSVDVPGVN